MKLFGGEKALMLMDPVEKEEAFFCYDNGRLLRQSGYYIYYEKNPQMQAYMLEKNPELNQPEQELVADDAVKTFRKIIQKKHTGETQETEERASVFSYAKVQEQSHPHDQRNHKKLILPPYSVPSLRPVLYIRYISADARYV